MLAFIPIAAELIKNNRRQVKLQANANAQALNIARAGLTDALAWFRRQATQPVKNLTTPDSAFYPLEANGDTEDESIGLVKEYDLGESNSLYARYEVVRQSTSTATNAHAVHDVSARRVDGAVDGEGLAWSLESVGYVYRRRDASVPYNQAPNEIVGRGRVSTEIRRVTVNPPINAAVVINQRRYGTVNTNCLVSGGTPGYGAAYYTTGASTPNNWAAGTRTIGGASFANLYDLPGSGTLNQTTIFGLTDYELRMMADYNVATVSELPTSYPSMSLVYINASSTFDDARPLRGGGILFVNGNLTVNSPTTPALFSGVIYVNGNATITGSAYVSGILMVTGTLTLNAGVDTAVIQYDPDIINSVRQDVGQYRENKGTYYVFSAFKS